MVKEMNMMLKRQLDLKKKGKKGFTLIEVIVVIVILAILAAIAVPNLTGYIDKAKARAVVADARNAEIAVTTIINDKVGNPSAIVPGAVAENDQTIPTGALPTSGWAFEINQLAGTSFYQENISLLTKTDTKLTAFVFKSGGWYIGYNGTAGKWGEPKDTLALAKTSAGIA
jgi:type IV pilus assembly protein PilA